MDAAREAVPKSKPGRSEGPLTFMDVFWAVLFATTLAIVIGGTVLFLVVHWVDKSGRI